MNISNLWDVLEYNPNRKNIIIEDLKKGLAPNLPYFIIGMEPEKKRLSSEIQKINTSLTFGLIKGQVGNGKSNLLKYLEFFFQDEHKYNVHPTIWRADIDRFDLILFLLYVIQQKFHKNLTNALLKLKHKEEYRLLCNNFDGSFIVIEEFVDKIIQYSKAADEQKISELIELGTGKVYDKASFKAFGIDKLTDYNRREVLVFFLNALAKDQCFIFFGIDELEKLQEKSRARFQTFLTSFRELIDLSSYINGHMILVAATDNIGNSSNPIESYNAALNRRIEKYIYETPLINKRNELEELTNILNIILETNKEKQSILDISAKVNQKKLTRNSDIVIHLCTMLLNSSDESWTDLLTKHSLDAIFDEKKKELLESDILLRIHQKFFTPLEVYCSLLANSLNDYEIKAQQYQCVYNSITQKCTIFLFNNDIESNLIRIRNVREKYPEARMINVFKPYSLDITMGMIHSEFNGQEKIDINNYDPVELMALLEISIDDYLNENLHEIISNYTKDM